MVQCNVRINHSDRGLCIQKFKGTGAVWDLQGQGLCWRLKGQRATQKHMENILRNRGYVGIGQELCVGLKGQGMFGEFKGAGYVMSLRGHELCPQFKGHGLFLGFKGTGGYVWGLKAQQKGSCGKFKSTCMDYVVSLKGQWLSVGG